MLLVTGPGHGAPANLANLWIDGCLEDIKPHLSRDHDGLGRGAGDAGQDDPEHLKALEGWLRSYRPEELFNADAGPSNAVVAMCPTGEKRMGANPHVNGGRLRVPLNLPDLHQQAVAVEAPGTAVDSALGTLGSSVRRI